MKYWGFLLLKLVAAGALMFVIWRAIVVSFRGAVASGFEQKPFGHDLGFTTVMLLYFLACFGLIHLIVWDQRYRCRTCLRRLRMPINTGSWGYMLQLGRPRLEYICPYGHGTLNIEELQITGKDSPAWTEHGDIWEELFAAPGEDRNPHL